MDPFAPIAIVGQGCALPGALSPEALWSLVASGRSAIGAPPAGTWRLAPTIDRARLDREAGSPLGGYVDGFDRVFDPAAFEVESAGLDPLFRWTMHAARQALDSAGIPRGARHPRGRVILGNLSYPTPALVDLAIETWQGAPETDPRNRFMSGLPALLTARGIGFALGGFALDAACASSLYAIKYACDALHDHAADLVLAGGVNHAESLFLHLGFSALAAASPTGRSRPFHREADGLVAAEGAAVVLLERLDDALAHGRRILGVIRGVGLSNDGRGRGLLVPVEAGQQRAMREAYARSGLSPDDISLVECHATGTAVGDATEVRSMRAVFAGARDLPIGSLKGNLGHLITASGAAALLKVLGAFAAGIRPATLHADDPIDELRESSLRLLQASEPWPAPGREPRRAAISNFGFGGNNAHLIVEEWTPDARHAAPPAREPSARPIAIVAQAVTTGAWTGPGGWTRALFADTAAVASDPSLGRAPDFTLDIGRFRYPPADLRAALAQQTLLLSTAVELDAVLETLPPERTALFVGMQCDAEIARSSLRWRRPGAVAGAATEGPLTAPLILGCMPNIVANRLGNQLDFTRETFTVSAEEASGNVALDLAIRALRSGEVDAAIAGAVDLSCEPIHEAAAARTLPGGRAPADAAALLVLKRLADAKRDGDPVVAVLDDPGAAEPEGAPGYSLALGPASGGLAPLIGHAHAASGLLHVAAAAAACAAHALPRDTSRPAMPFLPTHGRRRAQVTVEALGGARSVVTLSNAERASAGARTSDTRLAVFSAADLPALRGAVERGAVSEPRLEALRLAIVAEGEDQLAERTARATRLLAEHSDVPRGVLQLDDGIHLGGGPPIGEVAFVFTGPAGAYPGMGRELALGLPELVDRLGGRMASLHEAAGWLYEREAGYRASPVDKLWGSSFLIQLHAELTRGLLGIRPDAAIGYCSGETNALFALGAWSDLDGFRKVIDAHAVYGRELSGELRCVRRAWRVAGDAPVGWASLRVRAPIDEVRRALEGEPKVHLTIVNTRSDLVIAGEPEGCARVTERLGKHRARSLDYDFVMHCPEARDYRAEWRAIHHRPTAPVPGVRFYTHATLSSYAPTADAVADALTGQAMNPVDFPAMIERAFADGVRIFVEHGPHAGCTKWIGDILGDRPHLAVALDRYGESSLQVAAGAVAQLIAAGVPMDHGRLSELLPPSTGTSAPTRAARASLTLAAHLDPVRLPGPVPTGPIHDGPIEVMEPAPILPLATPPSAVVLGHTIPAPTSPLLAHQQKLAELHAAYLRHQAANHARFLQVVLGPSGAVPALRAVSAPVLAPKEASPPGGGPAPEAPRSGKPARRGPRPPTGPRFGRAELEVLASGTISTVFGPRFEGQDGYRRQVRMPEPPLLLADRVLGIEGEAGSMGLGTIWTETDIAADTWYLHEGRMPAGILVESGQADLLLISWLGVDAHNRGERVYRLLGCELTSHGELPRAGDTLTYEISVDGHANQGDVRLFFFHYDCWVNGELRVTVRNGQAGFFTDEELKASAGILWRADEAKPTPDARLDPPVVRCDKRHFSASDIDALVAGDALRCFGPGFERLATHTRTPSIQGGRMRLLDEVSVFDPGGGPWGRGYLRARLALEPDHWFFPGHFKNDPCMPGTLMFEGCLQALAIYLAALGFTIDRDGWRFEPVSEVMYPLRCRGQALPSSKEVVYEVFVDEIVGGAEPTIYADLLGSVDGLKAFHCRRMGLRLVPAWPLDAGRLTLPRASSSSGERDGAAEVGGFRFDHRSLLACALGRPSEAFGALYAPFDGVRRAPRLPGPPYHFMTRIARVDGPIGGLEVGSAVDAVYDVPPDAWYFDQGPRRVMPYAVLLEVALQPCGWLASYVGCASTSPTDLVFRNLDGTGTVHRAVPDDVGSLVTTAKLTRLSTAGGLIIVGFDVAVRARGTSGDDVYTFTTVFGFFPPEAMTHQIGLPVTEELRAALDEPSDRTIDLARSPDRARYFEHALRLPAPMLLMIDRITGLWPNGGRAGLGRIRADKDVDPREWFFKAHFFQDPVQPGSLGLEAMIQTLQAFVIAGASNGVLDGMTFEPIASDVAMTWKYRGQVVPEARRVTVDLELTALTDDPRGLLAVASGSLWLDGKRIYEVSGLGVRTVARPSPPRSTPSSSAPLSPRDPSLRSALKAFWRTTTAMATGWAGEDLLFALLDRFVGEIHLPEPPALDGRGALYVANHQVAAETILAALVIGGIRGTIPSLPAKAEHQRTWVGELVRLLMDRPGVRDPQLLRFVERDDPAAMLRYLQEELAAELRSGRSALVHVEGTRATSARHRVATMSSVFLDLAIETGVDVVPLRFTGGLPIAPAAARLELPVGYGKQAYWFGRPIQAVELARLPLAARTQRVLAAINELGPSPETESPAAPDAAFAEAVGAFRARHDVGEPQAAMAIALGELADPSDEGRALVASLRAEEEGEDRGSAFLRAIAKWLRGRR